MLFDIRTIVGALLGIYGIILVITGLVDAAGDEAKTGGININLWSGIGMAAVALAFLLWTLLRPVAVPPDQAPPKSGEPEPDSVTEP